MAAAAASAAAPASEAAGSIAASGSGTAAAEVREGRVRAVIDAVLPSVDGGRFPVKRIAGEAVAIEAHCFADGHDKLRVGLRWSEAGAGDEYELERKVRGKGVWQAGFPPPRGGRYRYTGWAWVDPFESWRHE